MDSSEKWQSLDRKLAAGFSLSDAAVCSGVTLEEAVEYAKTRLKHKEGIALELKLVAEGCLQTSLEILTKIAKAGPRTAVTDVDPESGAVSKSEPLSTDLDAAKALARLSIDTLKLAVKERIPDAQGEGKKRGGISDLFDIMGLWQLRNPNEAS